MRYAGKKASLATMHHKGELIAPAMASLGLVVFTADIDTDAFGTFSGEIERQATPLETAIAKARAGMEHTDSRLGIASEGSIGVQGLLPIVKDLEIVVFVDDNEGFVVAESAISYEIVTHSWQLKDGLPSDQDLTQAGFPQHGLIVRMDSPITMTMKGIHDLDELERAVEKCWKLGAQHVRLESDLRAQHCPSRQPTIAMAAYKLATRLSRSCPTCHCPGWGLVDHVRGRPCAMCHLPTDEKTADVFGCCRCDAQVIHPIESPMADPSTCARCNP